MSEQERIARMLADGKISPEEAQRLRAAMEESEVSEMPEVERIERPRLSRLAVAGALGLPAAFFAAMLMLAVALVLDFGRGGKEAAGIAAGTATGGVLFAGIILSICALVAIKGSEGHLKGRGFALFGLIAPMVLCVIVAITYTQLRLSQNRRSEKLMIADRNASAKRDKQKVLALWKELQTIHNNPTLSVDERLDKLLELLEPGWASMLRNYATSDQVYQASRGTLLGKDGKGPKNRKAFFTSSNVKSVQIGETGSNTGWLLIEGSEGQMDVPVIRVAGRWYFARGEMRFTAAKAP